MLANTLWSSPLVATNDLISRTFGSDKCRLSKRKIALSNTGLIKILEKPKLDFRLVSIIIETEKLCFLKMYILVTQNWVAKYLLFELSPYNQVIDATSACRSRYAYVITRKRNTTTLHATAYAYGWINNSM